MTSSKLLWIALLMPGCGDDLHPSFRVLAGPPQGPGARLELGRIEAELTIDGSNAKLELGEACTVRGKVVSVCTIGFLSHCFDQGFRWEFGLEGACKLALGDPPRELEMTSLEVSPDPSRRPMSLALFNRSCAGDQYPCWLDLREE